MIVRTYRSGIGTRAGFGITYDPGSWSMRPNLTILVWRRVFRFIIGPRRP